MVFNAEHDVCRLSFPSFLPGRGSAGGGVSVSVGASKQEKEVGRANPCLREGNALS